MVLSRSHFPRSNSPWHARTKPNRINLSYQPPVRFSKIPINQSSVSSQNPASLKRRKRRSRLHGPKNHRAFGQSGFRVFVGRRMVAEPLRGLEQEPVTANRGQPRREVCRTQLSQHLEPDDREGETNCGVDPPCNAGKPIIDRTFPGKRVGALVERIGLNARLSAVKAAKRDGETQLVRVFLKAHNRTADDRSSRGHSRHAAEVASVVVIDGW